MLAPQPDSDKQSTLEPPALSRPSSGCPPGREGKERAPTAHASNQAIVIDGGKIVEKGTHNELLAKSGFYYHLYMSQFKGQGI